MRKVYIASGFNSWQNKTMARAFNTNAEALAYSEGLTDPKIKAYAYATAVDLANQLKKEQLS